MRRYDHEYPAGGGKVDHTRRLVTKSTAGNRLASQATPCFDSPAAEPGPATLTKSSTSRPSMKPYVPQPLPLTCLDYARLIRKVGPANAALARYDGLLQSVINPGVMLSPLTNREAVLSSRIEGTQATVDEVLEYEAGMEFERDEGRGHSGDRQLSQGPEPGDGSPG